MTCRLVAGAMVLLGAVLLQPAVAPAQGRPLRVLVLHDMEGLAGQDDWRTFTHAHAEQYARGQRLLVADVNAVIEGLLEAGATKVDVTDGHGSGNTEPDIPLELLHPKAQMVFRDKPFDAYVDLVEPGAYDAVALVGMHGKPGSNGFAAHTSTPGMVQMMNGQSLTEPELIGYSWGRVGVPVIFVAGDNRLKENLAEPMPWIEFVVTKHATSASTATLIPVDQVHAEMRAAAKRALQKLDRMQAMKLRTPVAVALKAVPPASLEFMRGVPGIDYADNTVSFTAPDFKAARDGLVALMRVASTGGTAQMLSEFMRNQPNAQQLQAEYRDARTNRWFDYESGRWKPTPPTPLVLRRYHGSN